MPMLHMHCTPAIIRLAHHSPTVPTPSHTHPLTSRYSSVYRTFIRATLLDFPSRTTLLPKSTCRNRRHVDQNVDHARPAAGTCHCTHCGVQLGTSCLWCCHSDCLCVALWIYCVLGLSWACRAAGGCHGHTHAGATCPPWGRVGCVVEFYCTGW